MNREGRKEGRKEERKKCSEMNERITLHRLELII
jgi:hypothetical protein